jgi:hypothetical protein
MEIANTNTEFTFVIGYVIPEKVFQHTCRIQNKLEMKAAALILYKFILIILPCLFRNISLWNSFYAQNYDRDPSTRCDVFHWVPNSQCAYVIYSENAAVHYMYGVEPFLCVFYNSGSGRWRVTIHIALRNVIQTEALLATECTQTCLHIYMRTQFQAAVHNPTPAPTDMHSQSV